MKKIISTTGLKFAFFAGFIVLTFFTGCLAHINREAINEFLQRFPLALRLCVFVILYIVSNIVIGDAKDILKIIGAVLFGALISSVLIYIAEVVNACIFFHFSRRFGREYVRRKIGVKYESIYEKIGRLGFGWLLLLRCVPLLPFRFLDLTVGLTSIGFRKYMVAVLIGSPLRIFFIQFVLSAFAHGVSLEAFLDFTMKNLAVIYIAFGYVVAAFIGVLLLRNKLK